MLDRECNTDRDLPALVTKVSSRRQRRTDEDISSQDSAAVIIRRNSQETSSENLVKPQQEEQAEGGPQNSQQSSKTASLPSVEQYNEQKKGRNPYYCVPCKKNFARSSLSSHVKSKHRGKSPKVKCGLCDKVFDKAAKAQDHVSSTHKVYPCPYNGNSNLLTGAKKASGRQNSSKKSQRRSRRKGS